MEDSSETGYSYGDYNYSNEGPTEEERKTDKPETSKPRKILSHLKRIQEEGRLGLVKSELKELTNLTEGRMETILYKLASQGKVTFRDFPDPQLVDVEKPAVRVWHIKEV